MTITKILNQLQRTNTPKYSYAKIAGREASLDVPERIHFVWMGRVLPKKYIKNMRTFKNNTSYEVSNRLTFQKWIGTF